MSSMFRMAGQDPAAVAALLAAQAPGLAATGYGIYDLFAGDTNALNSGEFIANGLWTLLPGVGAGLGAAGAAVASPYTRGLMNQLALEKIQDRLNGARSRPADPAAKENLQSLLAAQAVAQEAVSEASMRVKPSQIPAGMSAKDVAMRRGVRHFGLGSALGAAAMAVPTVIAMMDQRSQQQPAS